MLRPKSLAILLILASTVGISFGGLIMRQIEFGNAWQITFHRNLAFFIAISLILVKSYRLASFGALTAVGRPGIIAGIFLAIANICFIHSLSITSVANTLFTLSAIPFITATIAFFVLKEVISFKTFLIMATAFLGIILMVSEGLQTNQFTGMALAFCTALSFSCFAIILRKYNYLDMIPCLLISSFFVIAITYIVSAGNIFIPIKEIAYCFFWGGVLSGFVNSAFIFATRYLSASEVTLFMLLEFSLGPMWVWLFLNETVSSQTLAGGAIVIFCVSVNSLLKLQESH